MDLLLPHLGLIVWTVLAFLIVLFILKKYAWQPILKGLNEREANIADSIATAEKVRLEMAQLKNENEDLLAIAREERAAMLKEAKEIKERMINSAKEDARVQAAQMIADAHVAIENHKMKAITDLKNQVGNLVIEVSEKILRRELTDRQAQENYIKELADEVKLN